MDFSATPILENQWVRLEPLAPRHCADLVAAVSDGELWRTWYAKVPAPDAMAAEIEDRLARQQQGQIAPWAVIDVRNNAAVGMTSYLNLAPSNRRLEIGSTWLGRATQGSKINPAAKLLLLERAFDELDCLGVELRTHWHNRQSRAAIEKLGAKLDGVLRQHMIMPNGTVRDTVVYSILQHEWPTVRCGLEQRLVG